MCSCTAEGRQRGTGIASRRSSTRPGSPSICPAPTARPPTYPEAFPHFYGGEPLTDDDLAFVVDPVRCVPDTVHHYFQPIRWSVAAAVPVTYVLNERDRPIPSATQEQMIGWLGRPVQVV